MFRLELTDDGWVGVVVNGRGPVRIDVYGCNTRLSRIARETNHTGMAAFYDGVTAYMAELGLGEGLSHTAAERFVAAMVERGRGLRAEVVEG